MVGEKTWMHANRNNTDATTSSPRLNRRLSWVSVAEVAAVTGAILALIWIVQPLGASNLDLALRLLIVASMLLSNIAHCDSRERLGIRLDNFATAARIVLPATAVVACAFGLLGLIVARPPLSVQPVALNFAYYLSWGFAQQYALQGFVLLRLRDAGLNRSAPVTAAALFALVHVPNPGLVAMTCAGGWLWCTMFRRAPNLLMLAISHALLAVVTEAMLPGHVTGGYRLGPRYLRWVSGRGQ